MVEKGLNQALESQFIKSFEDEVEFNWITVLFYRDPHDLMAEETVTVNILIYSQENYLLS